MKAFTLIFTALLIIGCRHAAPGVVADQPAAPRDPMYDLCMTTDFSRHTDQELHACGVWLGARLPVAVATPRPPTASPPSPTTYTVIKPNGKAEFLSCYGNSCYLLP